LKAGSIIRYEVIYKNLLRDLRKFYTVSFAEQGPSVKSKDPQHFETALQTYVGALFSEALLENCQVTKQEIAFCLASLIKPKLMLQRKSLMKPQDRVKIMSIYFYLYKFSLQRLQQMLESRTMSVILAYYI